MKSNRDFITKCDFDLQWFGEEEAPPEEDVLLETPPEDGGEEKPAEPNKEVVDLQKQITTITEQLTNLQDASTDNDGIPYKNRYRELLKKQESEQQQTQQHDPSDVYKDTNLTHGDVDAVDARIMTKVNKVLEERDVKDGTDRANQKAAFEVDKLSRSAKYGKYLKVPELREQFIKAVYTLDYKTALIPGIEAEVLKRTIGDPDTIEAREKAAEKRGYDKGLERREMAGDYELTPASGTATPGKRIEVTEADRAFAEVSGLDPEAATVVRKYRLEKEENVRKEARRNG